MRHQVPIPGGFVLAAVLLFCGASVCSAAQQATGPQKPESAPPVAIPIPAEALKLGTQFEAAAPADFLKWARNHAKRDLFKGDPASATESAARAVEKRNPKAPAPARLAATFLLFYLGYVQASESQTLTAARLQDLERQIGDADQQLGMAQNTPSKRAPGERPRQGVVSDEDSARQRLEDLFNQRDYLRKNLDSFQPKIDLCLERLAALYEQVKDTDPALLRQSK